MLSAHSEIAKAEFILKIDGSVIYDMNSANKQNSPQEKKNAVNFSHVSKLKMHFTCPKVCGDLQDRLHGKVCITLGFTQSSVAHRCLHLHPQSCLFTVLLSSLSVKVTPGGC